VLKSNLQGVRLLLGLNVAILIALPLLGLVSWSWAAVWTVLALYFVFDCLGIVLCYHRFQAHGTFTFRWKWMEVLFTLFGVLSGSGSPLGWCMIHNSHHKYSDTEKDPHSPIHGVWRVMSIDYPYEKNKWAARFALSKEYNHYFHEYYFGILLAYCALLYATWGLSGVYFGFSAPSVLILMAQGVTNFINHVPRFGYTNFQFHDDSRNIWWMAILNFGEGWHNNHHAKPQRYTTKYNWWEFDAAGSIIRLGRA